MRIPRIYQNCRLHSGDTVGLHALASHYIRTVLRLPIGSALRLFNGRGGEFMAVVHAIEKHKVCVKLGDFLDCSAESPVAISLVHGVAKGDRMDWVMQKATELGVSQIIPVITARCNVKLNRERWQKKQQHWQAIINHACEQCGRNKVPEVRMPQSLSEWVSSSKQKGALKLLLNPRGEHKLSALLRDHSCQKLVELVVGCEGGLNEEEVRLLEEHHYTSVCFGSRILRTETASVAALACIQMTWGDG